MDNNNVDNGNNRMFTEEEVNDIVRKRLERYKEKHPVQSDEETARIATELDARTAELSKREFMLDCKGYLFEKGYASDLIEVINADDIESFKEKADKLNQMIKKSQPAMPVFQAELPPGADAIASAFSKDNRHKPKDYRKIRGDD